MTTSAKRCGWARFFIVILALPAAFAWGFASSATRIFPHDVVWSLHRWARNQPTLRGAYHWIAGRPPGEWKSAERRAPGGGGRDEIRARLSAVGYLAGYEPAPGVEGVTVYDPRRAYNGLNLYVSGHAPEATLTDMRGNVLHRWRYEFREAFPDDPPAMRPNAKNFWRRAHLLRNGDILAIYDYAGLIKLDRDSNLRWANPAPFHHDLFASGDGEISALSVSQGGGPEEALDDLITVLDPAGNIVQRVSLRAAFERSRYASLLPETPRYFHTNTVELLDGSLADRWPLFKRGNALISLRDLDVIAIVDMEKREVVWALSGQWRRQHQPTLLANGHILLLDNVGHFGMSKVIEMDPFTQEVVWMYGGDTTNGFSTVTCGSAQRLPNGNTLVTESDSGRAFEVTADHEIVWEFYNPARAGKKGELIATLFEMVRIDAAAASEWLPGETAMQAPLFAEEPERPSH